MLRGRRILVTRRPEQAGSLSAALTALGAEVVEVPLIMIVPPEDPRPLDAALRDLGRFHWLVFTSANTVTAVGERMPEGARMPASLEIASVGPSTTRVLEQRFPELQFVVEPDSDYRAEGLLDALRGREMAGRRVLVPVSDRARDTVAEGLRQRGADVETVVAYRTITPPGTAERLARELDAGIDLATFASPSAVEGFTAAAGDRARDLPSAVIGPVTEKAARAAGMDVRIVATPATAEGLVAAIARALGSAAP